MLRKHDRIRLDKPVPLASGPVSITIRPTTLRRRARSKRLSLVDLAGIGREMMKGIDVDQWLRRLRDEWDHKTH